MTLVKVDGTTHQTWLKSPRFLPFRSAKNPADYATEKDDLAQTGNDQNQTGLCRSNTFNSGFQTSQQHSGVYRSIFHFEPIPLSITYRIDIQHGGIDWIFGVLLELSLKNTQYTP